MSRTLTELNDTANNVRQNSGRKADATPPPANEPAPEWLQATERHAETARIAGEKLRKALEKVTALERELKKLRAKNVEKEQELKSMLRTGAREQRDASRSIQKLRKQHEKARNELGELKHERARTQRELKQWQERASESAQRLKDAEDALSGAVDDGTPGKGTPDKTTVQERITQLTRNAAFYKQQADQTRGKLDTERQSREAMETEYRKRLEALESSLAEKDEEADATTTLLEQAHREIEKQKLAYRELTAASILIEEAEEAKGELTAKLRDTMATIESLESTLDMERRQHRETTEALQSGTSAITGDGSTSSPELEKAQAEVEALTTALADEREQRQRERDAASQRLAQQETTLKQARRDVPATQPEEAPESWHLKLDDGERYGPVSTDELCAWAKDCRIQPEHEVSVDGIHWKKAADLPILRMDWFVVVDTEEAYGPLNISAVRSLIGEGIVGREAPVYHKLQDELVYTAEILTIPDFAELAETVTDATERMARMAEALDLADTTIARLKDMLLSERSNQLSRPPKAIRVPPKSLRKQLVNTPRP